MRDDSLDAHVVSLEERLDDFLGQMLREIIKDILYFLADILAARRQGLKARHF